jgi:hypothetical protein
VLNQIFSTKTGSLMPPTYANKIQQINANKRNKTEPTSGNEKQMAVVTTTGLYSDLTTYSVIKNIFFK